MRQGPRSSIGVSKIKFEMTIGGSALNFLRELTICAKVIAAHHHISTSGSFSGGLF